MAPDRAQQKLPLSNGGMALLVSPIRISSMGRPIRSAAPGLITITTALDLFVANGGIRCKIIISFVTAVTELSSISRPAVWSTTGPSFWLRLGDYDNEAFDLFVASIDTSGSSVAELPLQIIRQLLAEPSARWRGLRSIRHRCQVHPNDHRRQDILATAEISVVVVSEVRTVARAFRPGDATSAELVRISGLGHCQEFPNVP
jgi:hypothetical protein